MTKIYLVRHGKQVELPGDPGLSQDGIIQVENTAKYFLSKNVNTITSSTYNRTHETAKIIATTIGSPLFLSSELRERINFGDVPNQGYRNFIAMCELSSQDRNYVLPNGETSISCGNRLKNFINTLSINQNHLVVAHGGIITDFLRNIFTPETLNSVYKDFMIYREVAIKHASITELEWSRFGLKLNSIGFSPK